MLRYLVISTVLFMGVVLGGTLVWPVARRYGARNGYDDWIPVDTPTGRRWCKAEPPPPTPWSTARAHAARWWPDARARAVRFWESTAPRDPHHAVWSAMSGHGWGQWPTVPPDYTGRPLVRTPEYRP